MFDQPSQNTQQSKASTAPHGGPASPSQGKATPPSNLPQASSQTPSASAPQPAKSTPSTQQSQVEDILAGMDSREKPPQLRPVSPPASTESDEPAPIPQPLFSQAAGHTPEDSLASIDQQMAEQGLVAGEQKESFSVEDSLSKNKTLFMVGIIGVVVIVLGIAGWIVYKKFYAPTPPDKPSIEEPTQPDSPAQPDVPAQSGTSDTPPIIEPPVTPPIQLEKDSDNDGLTDKEEIQLGTNPHKIDTDSDGLADYDELNVFNTDPTHADSDRDGYFDGEEVAKGFNPLGPGRFKSISKDTTEWMSYSNLELGLEFKYPKEFTPPQIEIVELPQVEQKSYQLSLEADDEMGSPRMLIYIDSKRTGPFLPDKFYKISEDNNQRLIIADVQEKNQGDENIQFFVTQEFLAQNSHRYLIQFNAQEGYEDYTILFNHLLSTFRFIKK